MPGLDTTLANTVGKAISDAAKALPKGADTAEDVWKMAVGKIFEAIVANAKANLPASAVVSTVATTGSAAAQTGTGTGPAAPLQLSIT